LKPLRCLAASAALVFAPALHAQAPACANDADLDYVCGADKPEDIIAIPGTHWLVASGFVDGAGLKLVDGQARRLTRWFAGTPDQIAPDRTAFPTCPGPVDPARFNARGLGLRRIGPERWRLLVVNHGGHQSIEAFDIDTKKAVPTLTWRGCLIMPEGQVGNAVASFADGTILVTVLTRPGTNIADFVAGKITGGVWQWRPGAKALALLPGTELPGNNGLEVDPDQRHFYVIAFGWHALLIYDRADTRTPVDRIDATDFMPDNVHWSGDRLLLAGMRLDEPACGGLRRIVDRVADPMLCHRGWIVGALDREHHRIATVAYGGPQPGFNGLSAATIAGNELWLGSFQADRIAVVRRWRPETGKQK
jgi:hypothetical protein